VSAGSASRAATVRVLAAVLGAGRTLEVALAGDTDRGLTPGEQREVQSLAYGTLRFGHRLQKVAGALLRHPWEGQAPELQALLLLGLYQLEYAGTSAYAAVSTTVEAARRVGQGAAAGLVNACLRRYQRERAALLDAADRTLAGRSSHPQWLVRQLQRDHPEDANVVLEANNLHPPLVLRANARRTTTASLAERLAAAGHGVRTLPFAPRALILEPPVDVRGLAEFQQGLCSVQDAAAQLAAPLLAAEPGMRVLDACAAPGGKVCHLLEEVPGLAAVVALDLDRGRVGRIEDNLARLGLAATVVVGDALDPPPAAQGPYQRILLDAPCSGTGVIRRHPDIKWLRRAADLPALVARQGALLAALWPQLAPGGRLVYATCSVLTAENAAVVRAFLERTPGAVDVTESASLALTGLPQLPRPAGPGIELLPGIAGTDGFYYACLERAAR
jgi:16S rRNA (cytosine967-C5)-methyltransferase